MQGVRNYWQSAIHHANAYRIDFRSAWEILKNSDIPDMMECIVQKMKLAVSPTAGVWAVHASVEWDERKKQKIEERTGSWPDHADSLASRGIDSVNAEFELMKQEYIRNNVPFEQHHVNWGKIADASNLSTESMDDLSRHGVSLIVCGHKVVLTPKLVTCKDVSTLHLDVGMSEGIPSMPATFGYGVIEPDGSIWAETSNYPKKQLGQL